MNATALPICFWCSLAPATHNMNNTLLGARPSCDACDPTTAPNGIRADVLDRMIGTLIGQAQLDGIDLGDERVVHYVLTEARYSAAAIELFQERATEQARRQMQRVARRFRPLDLGAKAVALGFMLVAWTAGFCILSPPAPLHRPAASAHAPAPQGLGSAING